MSTTPVNNSVLRISKLKGCKAFNPRSGIDWPNFPRTHITLRANRFTSHFKSPQAACPTVRLGRRRQARQNTAKVPSVQNSTKIFDVLGSWRGPFLTLFAHLKSDSGADTPPKLMPSGVDSAKNVYNCCTQLCAKNFQVEGVLGPQLPECHRLAQLPAHPYYFTSKPLYKSYCLRMDSSFRFSRLYKPLQLKAGGKPSTWLPPGRLVERLFGSNLNDYDIRNRNIKKTIRIRMTYKMRCW